MQIGNYKIIVVLVLLVIFALILIFFNFNLGIYQSGELGIAQIIVLTILLILLGQFKYYLWVHQTEEDIQREKKQGSVAIISGLTLLLFGIFDPINLFSSIGLYSSNIPLLLFRYGLGLLLFAVGLYYYEKSRKS